MNNVGRAHDHGKAKRDEAVDAANGDAADQEVEKLSEAEHQKTGVGAPRAHTDPHGCSTPDAFLYMDPLSSCLHSCSRICHPCLLAATRLSGYGMAGRVMGIVGGSLWPVYVRCIPISACSGLPAPFYENSASLPGFLQAA